MRPPTGGAPPRLGMIGGDMITRCTAPASRGAPASTTAPNDWLDAPGTWPAADEIGTDRS